MKKTWHVKKCIWTSEKLENFMLIFRLNQKTVSEETDIERSTISRLLTGECKFEPFNDIFEGYFRSKLAGKRAELLNLIAWYEQRFK